MVRKIISWITHHTVASIILAIVVVGGGYYLYSGMTATTAETRYVLGTAQKGTVIVSVTGTGQVSASNQIDIKSQASGNVLSVPVVAGQAVKAGQLLVQIDPTTAQKAVRDAETNLTSANLALQKLQQPADQLSLTQAENSLANAQDSKQKAQDDLTLTYASSFTDISNSFLDFPSIMTNLHDTIFNTTAGVTGVGQSNADFYTQSIVKYTLQAQTDEDDTFNTYQIARTAFDKNFAAYKATSSSADTATIDALLQETYATAKNVSDAIKSTNNLIQFYKDTSSNYGVKTVALADTQLAALGTATGQVNSHLSNLLNDVNTIQNDGATIINAERTITENTESLDKLKSGADMLDIQSAQLTITQRKNALLDAQQTLANYTIRAPFDGTVAVLPIKITDTISNGTTAATLITPQQIATISLNEVDAAKVQVGQKVTLTFDAISDLSIAGQVASIDTLGTVSQGVVTYNVKISFDTQDTRIKPGMSVSASIVTAIHQDVLTVPNSAIKTQGSTQYVQILDTPGPVVAGVQGVTSATAPRQQTVVVGLASDTVTEISSGLNEGDSIITRTITPTTKAATATAPSLIGGGGGAGGARRFGGG